MYRFRGGWLTKDLYGAVPTVINTGGGIVWLLLDRFNTDRAAGAVNGTPSEPSGHTRTVTDSGNAAVITGGQFKTSAGAAARDPWLRYATGWARLAGRMLRFTASAANSSIATDPVVGLATTLINPNLNSTLGFGFMSSLRAQGNVQIMSYVDGTLVTGSVILRSTGYFLLLDGKLRWINRADATATLYPHLMANGLDATVDQRLDNLGIADLPLTVPTLYPTPTLSDTFSVPQIVDYGDNALHGTPVNVGLNGSEGKYNGTSSYTNIYSAGLDTLFDGAVGTVIVRAKVRDADVWGASFNNRYIIRLEADANNFVRIRRANPGELSFFYSAGGVAETVTKAGVATLNFMSLGATWDLGAGADGEFKTFFDGVQEGVTQTALGTWTGAVAAANIGSYATTTLPWSGSIADCILANTVASPAQMSTIHTALAAGTLSKATLDGIFGAGNYVWYKHNEQYLSNGLAHVETNTVQALDAGGNSLHGTHRNVKLNGSYGTYDPALLSYTDILSTGLNTLFDELKGTLVARCKLASPQTLTDGVLRAVIRLGADGSNVVDIRKSTSANNIAFIYTAGGTTKLVNKANFTELGWYTPGLTWDKAGDAMKAYYNGAQEGSTQTSLGVWAGALAGSATALGAANNTPTSSWDGSIGDVILANVVATPQQMADLHTYLTAGTLTADILNTMFGANNWAWYRMDEAVTYPASVAWNGSGHFHNAGGKAYISPTPGAELLTNGSFAAWTGDNPDGWTTAEIPPNSQITQNPAGQCQIISTDGTEASIEQTAVAANNFYRASLEITAAASGAIVYMLGTSSNAQSLISGTLGVKIQTRRAVLTPIRIKREAAACNITIDNASVTLLPFVQCLRAVAPASAGEPYQSVKMTITANTQAGGMINLDSYSNPQYGIHWWVDRVDGKLYARKLVAGVWQADSIAGTAVTYSAGAYGEIRRIGNEIYVFYNGSFVATFDASDVPTSNTLQALFATDSGSYFESDTSYPTGSYDYSAYA